MYTSLEVVVDGALSDIMDLEPCQVDDEIARIRDEFLANPIGWFDVQVFTLDHDHPRTFDSCECIQFELTTHPKHHWVIEEGRIVA